MLPAQMCYKVLINSEHCCVVTWLLAHLIRDNAIPQSGQGIERQWTKGQASGSLNSFVEPLKMHSDLRGLLTTQLTNSKEPIHGIPKMYQINNLCEPSRVQGTHTELC